MKSFQMNSHICMELKSNVSEISLASIIRVHHNPNMYPDDVGRDSLQNVRL